MNLPKQKMNLFEGWFQEKDMSTCPQLFEKAAQSAYLRKVAFWKRLFIFLQNKFLKKHDFEKESIISKNGFKKKIVFSEKWISELLFNEFINSNESPGKTPYIQVKCVTQIQRAPTTFA